MKQRQIGWSVAVMMVLVSFVGFALLSRHRAIRAADAYLGELRAEFALCHAHFRVYPGALAGSPHRWMPVWEIAYDRVTVWTDPIRILVSLDGCIWFAPKRPPPTPGS